MQAPPLFTRRTALLSAGTLGLLAFAAPLRAAERSVTGSGREARETRALAGFDAVRLRGSLDVVLRQGPTALELHGDDNLLALVETAVVDSDGRRVLELRWKPGVSIRGRGGVTVHASAPDWRAVALEGSGDLRLDALSGERLDVALAGSGDLRLGGLALQALAVQLAGSGDLRLAGTAQRLSVALQGSGDVWADELAADEVEVTVAGSGDVRVHAQRMLRAAVAGSGDVVYRGTPKLQLSLSGSGRVTRR